MFADTWRFAETVANTYTATFKSDTSLNDMTNLNRHVVTNPLVEPTYPTFSPQSTLFNHLLGQIYTQPTTITRRHPPHQPNQQPDDDSLSPPGFDQQQKQFFELFMKFLKQMPQKSDSPTKTLAEQSSVIPLGKNQPQLDISQIAQDLSLTKCSDSKDISLDLNNLSSSTWGTIPSPPDKSSPILNQSEMLLDFKSPTSSKDLYNSNLIGPDPQQQQQRRQPFTHLNYPCTTTLNCSTSPRKSHDLQTSDHWKFHSNQSGQTSSGISEGQDWDSQFKAMCDRLHKNPVNPVTMTLSDQPSSQIGQNQALVSAHYYSQLLRCQHYYESYLQWFRVLGMNRLGQTDMENGQPALSPTATTPALGQVPPTHQTPIRPFPYASPLAPNPFYPPLVLDSRSASHCIPTDLSSGRRCPNNLKTKRHSPLKAVKTRSHLPHFGTDTTNKHDHPSSSDSFANSTDENQHFACKLCPKIYSQASALKMHVRTHTLPCRCSYCGKSFSRKWLLKGHERTHTGERPYACSICNRSFADRSNLRAHLQTHQRDKRYSCPRCPRSFSRMGLLNKHMTQCTPSLGHLSRTLIDEVPPQPLLLTSAPSSSTPSCRNSTFRY